MGFDIKNRFILMEKRQRKDFLWTSFSWNHVISNIVMHVQKLKCLKTRWQQTTKEFHLYRNGEFRTSYLLKKKFHFYSPILKKMVYFNLQQKISGLNLFFQGQMVNWTWYLITTVCHLKKDYRYADQIMLVLSFRITQ